MNALPMIAHCLQHQQTGESVNVCPTCYARVDYTGWYETGYECPTHGGCIPVQGWTHEPCPFSHSQA